MTAQAWREPLILGALIVSAFAWRAQRSDQPILEGYVGRQVPTAMVARNLNRGSGFLAPQLDTGPFPKLFLVEPPIYAQVVAWLSGGTGLAIDRIGRLVSAASIGLACWGLHGLVRRREGVSAATLAVIALAVFPATIKYGRAVQPDALTLGLSVAGLRCWDDRGSAPSIGAGWILCSMAMAQKVTWSFLLFPLLVAILRNAPARLRWLAVSTLIPALAWYAFAAGQLEGETGGVAASQDNAANWLSRLSPMSFIDPGRFAIVGVDLFVRSFTPLGSIVVVAGFGRWRSSDRLWPTWTVAALLTLIVLFGKLHHDYYWLMIAAPFAAWIGIGLERMPRKVSMPLLVGLMTLGLLQSRSTWRTPDDWRDAPALAESIRKVVPADRLVIAPEAILYLGDRRGCRLEVEPEAVKRAANEWRPAVPFVAGHPIALVEFYREQAGARVFADLDSPASRPFHDDLKRRPGVRVIEDIPGRYLILGFDGPEAPRP